MNAWKGVAPQLRYSIGRELESMHIYTKKMQKVDAKFKDICAQMPEERQQNIFLSGNCKHFRYCWSMHGGEEKRPSTLSWN